MTETDPLTPLIISGAPRSGTSLLYNLFDGHPEVSWLLNEAFLFEYLFDLGEDAALMLDCLPRDPETLVAGLRDKQVMPPLHEPYRQSRKLGSMSEIELPASWDEDAFRAALAGPRGDDVAGLWRFLVRTMLAGTGEPARRYACLKSPDFGKSTAAALRHVPDARGLVILRDPLYSLDSLKRSREMRGEKLLSWPAFAATLHQFRMLHRRIADADPARLKCLRYEDLVADPKSTMEGVADWLGIAWDACLTEPTMRGETWPGISSFAATEGIETRPAERPIQSLTPEEQAVARERLHPFRSAFGYGADPS